MYLPFFTRLKTTAALLLVCATVQAQGISQQSSCKTAAAVAQEFRKFSELLLRLTRDQIHQSADAKYLIGIKALDKGWRTADEQDFIAKFLASPDYLDLQREREPHNTVIASVQANWRQEVDPKMAKSLCESSVSATAAITRSYEINKRELAVLNRMLDEQ